jgi:phosphoribosylformylglycinamidine cyclo-ligase
MNHPGDRPLGPGLTYRDAGVDSDAGDALVERIKALAAPTRRPGLVEGIGGFAALFSLKDLLTAAGGMRDPLLVSGTDGVGTKLKLAFRTGRHDTVGIDLVAMCVNDVLTTGATPLFFLDYFATGRLEVEVAAAVIAGIAEGCRRGECALVGGETAELPGMYAAGEYDLAGFCVGLVDRDALVDGRSVAPGDAVLGVLSRGIHSNGLSLAQKALFERGGLRLDARLDGLELDVAEELLRPTAIYTATVKALLASVRPKAMAHITGGGLPGNVPRVLPEGVVAELDLGAWTRPAIFEHIQAFGGIAEEELQHTFNLGVGLVVVVAAEHVEPALAAIRASGEAAAVIGKIRARRDADEEQVELLR